MAGTLSPDRDSPQLEKRVDDLRLLAETWHSLFDYERARLERLDTRSSTILTAAAISATLIATQLPALSNTGERIVAVLALAALTFAVGLSVVGPIAPRELDLAAWLREPLKTWTQGRRTTEQREKSQALASLEGLHTALTAEVSADDGDLLQSRVVVATFWKESSESAKARYTIISVWTAYAAVALGAALLLFGALALVAVW